MIASFIPGRVRLRSGALKNPENMQTLLDMAKGFEGIKSIKPNPDTGSILVHYDPAVISDETLAQAAAAFADHFPEEAESACGSGLGLPGFLKWRHDERKLMLAALGMTVGALAFSTRAHASIGGFFLLLAGKHIYSRKGRLFQGKALGRPASPNPSAGD